MTIIPTFSRANFVIFALLAICQSPGLCRALPELPRTYVDTNVPDTSTYQVLRVDAGGNLQAALDSAVCGTVVELAAGSTFNGNFILPDKGDCASKWIVVTSSRAKEISARRARPDDTPLMAKIVARNSDPALRANPKANHYRIVGLEVTAYGTYVMGKAPDGSDITLSYGLVRLGTSGAEQDTAGEVPWNLVVDRSYIHGHNNLHVKWGVLMHCRSCAVVDSYISEIHGLGQDTQAVECYNGPGPIKLLNNHLEGGAENVMFGGAAPSILGLIPADIEIRRNYFYKPLSWKSGHPSYAGIHWSIKNLFELKFGRRMLIEGNVFENNWADAQVGFGFVLKASAGDTSGAVTEDITIRKNLVRNSQSAFNVSGTAGNGTDLGPLNRLLVEDTIIEGTTDILFQVLNQANDVTINHTTGFQKQGSTAVFDGGLPRGANFSFTNNIALHNLYGVKGSGTGSGTSALETYFPGSYSFKRNVIIANINNVTNPEYYHMTPEWFTKTYPADNFFPFKIEDVRFTDYHDGLLGDYTLLAASPYKNGGTDGRDIGADIAAVAAAIDGVIAGSRSDIAPAAPRHLRFGP